MDTILVKYNCGDKQYLVFDPGKNEAELDAFLLRQLRYLNCSQGIEGIVQGPFCKDSCFGLNLLMMDGTRHTLTEDSLAVFKRYLQDEGYLEKTEEQTRSYAGVTENQNIAEAAGKIYLN